MIKACEICDKEFYARPSLVKKGLNKYCSRGCSNKGLTTSIQKKCITCEKSFKIRLSELKRGKKACSFKCHLKYNMGKNHPMWKGGKLKKKCLTCNRVFLVWQYRKNAKCCSRKCVDKYASTKRGKETGNWRGGKLINNNGYVLIRNSDHPMVNRHGYVQEHRLVMEKKLGRYLTKKEVAHHINGIKNDNRIENLQLMDSTTHKSYHAKERGLGTHA